MPFLNATHLSLYTNNDYRFGIICFWYDRFTQFRPEYLTINGKADSKKSKTIVFEASIPNKSVPPEVIHDQLNKNRPHLVLYNFSFLIG